MIKLLVIADDFTGALDTGIQFVKKGIETQIITEKQLKWEYVSQTARVLVIDPETRLLSAKEAYEVVKDIVYQAVRMGVQVIYKKTDSALRGNVGSELSAVLDGADESRLYFIPAFPAAQRCTHHGIQYINGERLENSSFRYDPFNPMTSSYVPEILAKQTETKIISVKKEAAIPALSEKREIVVFDAVKNADIQKRVEDLKKRKELYLLAGCAGFASFLPEALDLCGNYHGEVQKTKYFGVACGSLNSITEKQIEYAEQNGFYRKTLRPEQKLDPQYYETKEGQMFVEDLSGAFREKQFVEIDTFDGKGSESTREFAEKIGMHNDQIRFAVASSIGKIVRGLVQKDLNMTVLLTGGDTLMGVMKELGVNQIYPIAEVGQGTVLSKLFWEDHSLQVISKSGGFGEKEVLVRLARELTLS